jgi:hypothetical protein
MISKSQFVFAALVFLLASCSFAAGPKAQSATYRAVGSSDLLGGYIPNGEWIEVTGHAWFSDQGMFLNVNQPSARVPIRIDVANVGLENMRRMKSECGSPDQFRGGCLVAIRGQTGTVGDRQGILATGVQILPKQ